MARKNNSALFFTCSLIEFIGRERHLERNAVVTALGRKTLERIYEYADVLHCEPIAKVGDEFINSCNIESGTYHNVEECKYAIPDYWTIGAVYERLIEDTYEEEHIIEGIQDVYGSWINKKISNYNTDFYYQNREYIGECYKEGKVL